MGLGVTCFGCEGVRKGIGDGVDPKCGVGLGVGVGLGEGVGVVKGAGVGGGVGTGIDAGTDGAKGLEAFRKGTNSTVPRLVAFL